MSFPKINTYGPPLGAKFGLEMGLHTHFLSSHRFFARLLDMDYGYFLLDSHVLIEIYPLVPFPPSVCKGVSDVRADVLRRGAVTSAEAIHHPFDVPLRI